MACTINLFAQLGGTPETGGNWFATSGPFPFDLNFGTCPSAGTPLNVPAAHTQIGVGHNICIDLTGAPQGPYVFTYVLPADRTSEECSFDCIGCTTVTINTVPAPQDGGAEYCSNVNECINLYNLLGNAPSTNGNWESLNAPWPFGQSNDNNGTNDCFRPIDFGTGSFEFKYTINSDVPCDNCSASVVVDLTPAPMPGETNEINICEGVCPLNLFANLGGSPDTGGNWFYAGLNPITVKAGTCPDADTPTNLDIDVQVLSGHNICIDFEDVSPGTYRFTYVVPDGAVRDQCNVNCVGCADLIVNILAAPVDGEPIEICEGDGLFYLFNLLGNTPSTNGNWACSSGCGGDDWGVGYSPDNNGANDYFVASDLGPGSYIFTYTLNSAVPCDTCDADVRVDIIAGPVAGDSETIKVCN